MLEKLQALINANDVFLDKYINLKAKLRVKCTNGHTRTIIPSNLVSRGTGATCKECEGILANNKYTVDAINSMVSPFTLEGEYLGSLVKHNYKCQNNHIIEGKLLQQMKNNYRCKQCYPLRSDIRTTEEFASIVKEYGLTLVSTYTGAKIPVSVRCTNEHTYSIIPSNFTSHGTGNICLQCNPQTSSIQEEVYTFVSKHTGTERNNRSILNGLEIDIWIPRLNLGIEVNGDYWHSDKFKDKNYHLNKLKDAEQVGVQLLFIREYDWYNKQDIIKSMILSKLNKNVSIGARRCSVRKLDYFPSTFLEANHLQGCGSPTSYNYGLFFQEELVAVMTFSKPRFNSNYEYELVRFCSLTGVQIIGGASKLLNMFLAETNTHSLITYAKRDYSNGDLYAKIGFEHTNNTVPGYIYYKNRKTLTRYQCQKHKLKELMPSYYKDELSETEIMKLAGYTKIYDTGNMVYVLK